LIDDRELQRLVHRLVAAGAPGAAGLAWDETGTRQAAGGAADLSTGRPMRPGLRFRAGSLTKSLVATVVLQLVAESRLSLQDTVERWLPGVLPYGDQLSVGRLLNHTSGVPDYTPPVFSALYESPEARLRSWAPRDLVGLVADQPPRSAPGGSWSYSNTGYILLGLIVEAASGSALGQQLDRRLLGPLGLGATVFPDRGSDLPSPSSRGYSLPMGPQGQALDGPLLDFTAQDPSWAWAAGALVSNLEDLATFLRALLGGRLLPARLLAEMQTTVPVPPASIPLPLYDRYGMGLIELDTPAGRLVGHPGGIPGFLSVVLSAPDGRRQLALMVNALSAPAAVYEVLTRAPRALGGGASWPGGSAAGGWVLQQRAPTHERR
jgi:D-alanyl-D-alanine carboxypeptidase